MNETPVSDVPVDDKPVNDAPVIVVTAVIVTDTAGRMLTVRKRGTRLFMNPGGKPEPGETPDVTGARELGEEVGLDVDPAELELVGQWVTAAANEAGHELRSTVYRLPRPIAHELTVAAEIAELRWLAPDENPDDLAPLLRELRSVV